MTIRLVLADDHMLVLQGLDALLGTRPDLEVVELCTDGLEAVEATRRHRPDVLVLDLGMPGCDGVEVLRLLGEDALEVATVVLTASIDDDTLQHLIKSAVGGIMLKDSASTDLIAAIRAVAAGRRWIGPELTARALRSAGSGQGEPDGGLTPREREVVLHVAEGLPNRRVASRLAIAESTVKLHLRSAFGKLNVTNRTQLSLLARERGWI